MTIDEAVSEMAHRYRLNDKPHLVFTTEFNRAVCELYAAEKLRAYKISRLPRVQRRIFDVITDDWLASGVIARKTGLLTRDITPHMLHLVKHGLVIDTRIGKLKSWKRRYEY